MENHRVGAATTGRLPASALPGPLPPGKYSAGLNLHPHPGKCRARRLSDPGPGRDATPRSPGTWSTGIAAAPVGLHACHKRARKEQTPGPWRRALPGALLLGKGVAPRSPAQLGSPGPGPGGLGLPPSRTVAGECIPSPREAAPGSESRSLGSARGAGSLLPLLVPELGPRRPVVPVARSLGCGAQAPLPSAPAPALRLGQTRRALPCGPGGEVGGPPRPLFDSSPGTLQEPESLARRDKGPLCGLGGGVHQRARARALRPRGWRPPCGAGALRRGTWKKGRGQPCVRTPLARVFICVFRAFAALLLGRRCLPHPPLALQGRERTKSGGAEPKMPGNSAPLPWALPA